MANFHLSRAMMDDGEYEYIQKKVEDGVWAGLSEVVCRKGTAKGRLTLVTLLPLGGLDFDAAGIRMHGGICVPTQWKRPEVSEPAYVLSLWTPKDKVTNSRRVFCLCARLRGAVSAMGQDFY